MFLLIAPWEASTQVQDTTPPQLVAFSYSPMSIDTSSGSQDVTFTARITDNISGFLAGGLSFRSPSGQQFRGTSFQYPNNLTSGTAQDGTYQFLISFPQFSEAGTWRIDNMGIIDQVGNNPRFTEADLINLGFTTTLQVSEARPPVAVSFYLHGDGPNNNPPTLFLNSDTPSNTTARFKDSPGIKFGGGNPWKEVGVWAAAPAPIAGTLTQLNDLRAWLGLKNGDDQGTRFDLRAEVYKNGVLVAAGETYCIQGVTRNPSLAKEAVVSFAPFSPATLNGSTDELSLKVLTRIGSDGAGGSCGGHGNATGLRLYFDSVSRPSSFNAMIAQ
jgi:hypothetical protein